MNYTSIMCVDYIREVLKTELNLPNLDLILEVDTKNDLAYNVKFRVSESSPILHIPNIGFTSYEIISNVISYINKHPEYLI